MLTPLIVLLDAPSALLLPLIDDGEGAAASVFLPGGAVIRLSMW